VFEDVNTRKMPPIRSTDALVTVFTFVATEKMVSVLTPRE
jgi:hypothetical protein